MGKYRQFSVLGHGYLTTHTSGFWFRIFGYGLAFDIDLPVLYSERHGFRRVSRFGRIAVEVLHR
jgi:hypothetical protein